MWSFRINGGELNIAGRIVNTSWPGLATKRCRPRKTIVNRNMSIRRDNQRVLTDGRIVGTGDFVDRIRNEADERLKYQLAGNKGRQQIGEVIERVCEEENINSHELRMGSRRRRISQVRAQIVHRLVENFGIPLAEVARQVGVSTSAISKALNRTIKN